MRHTFKAVLLFVVMATVVGSAGMGVAYAQTDSSVEDQAVIIVVSAVVVGSLTGPLYGWATQKPDAEGKVRPFDKPQYARAVIVGLVGNTLIMVGQLQLINVESLSLLTTVILFVNAFVAGVGINALKSGGTNAIKK